MRHQDLETEAHHQLRRIVRTVDKKIQLQVQDGPSPQDPLLTLQLVQGTQQATMEVSASRRVGRIEGMLIVKLITDEENEHGRVRYCRCVATR